MIGAQLFGYAGGVAGRGKGSGDERGLYGSEIGANIVRASTGELVGTFILVYAGAAVAAAAVLAKPVAGAPYNSLAVPLAFGVALVAIVASLGHVSGAHVNPAVTVGLAAARRFPWRLVPPYLGAQLGGAILAGLAIWLTLGHAARSKAKLGATFPASGVSDGRAVVVELLITAILVFVWSRWQQTSVYRRRPQHPPWDLHLRSACSSVARRPAAR